MLLESYLLSRRRWSNVIRKQEQADQNCYVHANAIALMKGRQTFVRVPEEVQLLLVQIVRHQKRARLPSRLESDLKLIQLRGMQASMLEDPNPTFIPLS